MHLLNTLPQSLNSAADGTVAAPSISFLADQDTGIYRIGANNLGVAAGGVLRFIVDPDGITSRGLNNQILTTDYVTSTTGTNMQLALLTSTGDTSGKLEVYTQGGAAGGVLNINTSGGGAVNFGSGNATFGGNIILPLNGYIGKSNLFALQFGGTDYGFVNPTTGYSVMISNAAPTNSLVIAATTGAATFVGAVVAPSLTAPASTALALAAGSGNQNITLTPSGTGVLSVVTANTIAGALTLGNGAGVMTLGFTAGTNAKLVTAASTSFAILPGGSSNLFTFLSNGTFLVGTGTDSSNGRLQLSTHTTSAGGIGFGTDVSLYRAAADVLALASGDALQLGNAYVGTVAVSTGTVTIRDSTGTVYRLLCVV